MPVKTAIFYSALVACLVLTGCAKPDPEPTGVIPQQQLDALEQANGVEQALLDADQKRREDMERQGI
jgi:hypothetical protein